MFIVRLTDRNRFAALLYALWFISALAGLNASRNKENLSKQNLNDFLGYNEFEEKNNGHPLSYMNNEIDDIFLDIAVKLKREFADDLVSDLFASSYDLIKIARATELDKENRLFHFRIADVPNWNDENKYSLHMRGRAKRHVENKIDMLRKDDRVDYALPQHYLKREKREIFDSDLDFYLEKFLHENEEKASIKTKRKKLLDEFEKNELRELKELKEVHLDLPANIDFNDVLYKQQWYLINDGQLNIPAMHDLNVRNAWLNGYTGKNITVVIIDDGLDHEHPDFEGKYRADLSFDYNDENDTLHDPMPSTFDSQNNHGTRCAGAAVANANNSFCGVGIAYDAQIAGIRILDGPITDLLEGRAISYKVNETDIKSASWGPKDDGAHMEYPGKFVNMALDFGVKYGRGGKGTLFIWASGNGGANEDDCSCDGYVSNWNVISIGSINHHGVMPYFMELCPSTMAVVYSGGQSHIAGNKDDPGIRVVTSDVRGKCTSTFQGTSSAAPLAAGALALVLEANPDLTYRDVMHLIAKTSRVPNIEDKNGWIINGARYHVNEKYGFGVLDVGQMIQEAQSWKNVPERQMCTAFYNQKLPILKGNDDIHELELNVDNCSQINSLEHVVANISFSYSIRGDIKMTLISPSGTPSEILSYRKNDRSAKGVNFFPFMTIFNWGESPLGKWKLLIETRTRPGEKENQGSIDHFSINFFGYQNKNDVKFKKRFTEFNRAFEPTSNELEKIYKRELKSSRQSQIIHKRVLDSNPELRSILKEILKEDNY